MKKVLSKVLVAIMAVSMMIGILSISCRIEQQRRFEQAKREQINQIRSSSGYIIRN